MVCTSTQKTRIKMCFESFIVPFQALVKSYGPDQNFEEKQLDKLFFCDEYPLFKELRNVVLTRKISYFLFIIQ